LVVSKEFLGDRRRSQEEEYFHKQEQQLIARLQQRNRDETARRQLSERTGVVDTEVLADLDTLGYTPDTVLLLHLVPLIQVAWAEGGVSDRERQYILEAARASGVTPGSAADAQLANWLSSPPPPEFFEKTLRVIGTMLRSRPAEERQEQERDLLSYCTAIATISGGILGLGKVSREEQDALARIAQEVGRRSGE